MTPHLTSRSCCCLNTWLAKGVSLLSVSTYENNQYTSFFMSESERESWFEREWMSEISSRKKSFTISGEESKYSP